MSTLNSFYQNINISYELKTEGNLPFLYALLVWDESSMLTKVNCKLTYNDVYMHWESNL